MSGFDSSRSSCACGELELGTGPAVLEAGVRHGPNACLRSNGRREAARARRRLEEELERCRRESVARLELSRQLAELEQ